MDVDFMPYKEDKDIENKANRGKKEEIEWTKPIKDAKARQATGEADEKKNDNIKAIKPAREGGFLSFFKKREKNGLLGKSKIKKSRKEILELIDREKKEKPIAVESDKDKEKNKSSWLNNLFKKKPRRKKEVLVDYQKILEEERGKRKPAVKEEIKETGKEQEIKEDKEYLPRPQAHAGKNAKILHPLTGKGGQAQEDKDKMELQEEKRDEKKEPEASANIMGANLIKGKIIAFFDWKKNIFSFLMPFIIACLLVAGAYGGLSWWSKKQEAQSLDMAKKFEELEKQIKQTEKNLEEIFIFKKKLKLAGALLNQHTYWTNFFDFLEENTLPNVYYLNFSGDDSGSYNLPVVAKDFSDIEAQVRQMLKSDYVIEAKVDKGSMAIGEVVSGSEAGAGMVNFGLSLSLDPAIFIK